MPKSWAAPVDRPLVISDNQAAVIRTVSGVPIGEFYDDKLVDASWSRELSQVSRCSLTIPSGTDIQPWLHWVSVFDDTGQDLYWEGPVQKVADNGQQIKLVCFDVASLYTRTRCPIGKQWYNADPADIANELVSAMIAHHGRPQSPIVRYDPYGDKFDYSVKADESMLDSHIDDLVRLGLSWTVVSGVPILGPLSHTPIAALDEDDFVGEGMTLVRDGSGTYNDVLLRSGDSKTYAKREMAGLALQTIVDADSVSGVSNTDRATKQMARYSSQIHQTIELPSNAVLVPDAPVNIKQLIPSARLKISFQGTILPVQLTGADVSYTPGSSTAAIRVAAVDDELPELITLKQKTPEVGR